MERPTKAAWWRKRGEEGDARAGESCEVSLGRSFETRGEGTQARWANSQHWRVTDYEGGSGWICYVLQDASALYARRTLVLFHRSGTAFVQQ
jgi:hypothetical protein